MRGLDRRIDIERRTGGLDEYGQPLEEGAWSTIVENRPAAIFTVRGDERYTADQFVAQQQIEFRIRWSQNVADVSPTDRIIYPSYAGSPIPQPVVFDIIEVTELGRREALRIIAARRAEE